MVTIGWDVGGAHLKAARVEDGRVAKVVQMPSPIWRGLDHLDSALREAVATLGVADRHALTMTGELSDIFPDRPTGVCAIIATMQAVAGDSPLLVYAGAEGFVTPEQVAGREAAIASANWHASAALAASRIGEAVFVDIGSTTSDIIPLVGGVPLSVGSDDSGRLASGELVYTGITRGFLMSLGPLVPFAGGWTRLANEDFASMADVYRLLGMLPDGADQLRSADGRGKSLDASRARLARMVGRDGPDASDLAWRGLAAWFAEAQLRAVGDGLAQVLSRGLVSEVAPLVGAGIGRFVVEALARRFGRDFRDFGELISVEAVFAGDCAPAVAMALLGEAAFVSGQHSLHA